MHTLIVAVTSLLTSGHIQTRWFSHDGKRVLMLNYSSGCFFGFWYRLVSAGGDGGGCNSLKACWDFCSGGITQREKPQQPNKTLRRPVIYVLTYLTCSDPKNTTQENKKKMSREKDIL